MDRIVVKDSIKNKVMKIFACFEQQIELLQEYKYVDVGPIEHMWDRHIRALSGVSVESYQLIEEFYLDGCVRDLNITEFEELIEYLTDRAIDNINKKAE